eukprot:CAMPEP_0118933264 /NCGR_PEP_ID=MMETSP1169-20130426/11854_1 /TAXON_ID=36882 /ORGANISM="Pyramimonas obovata, Strain CCMP722" /LENGTH=541 /DNA_ID=CAMNT_0006876003 /DNA_START=92 /DNA_END=1717 /DNA_ORIENTATION=-
MARCSTTAFGVDRLAGKRLEHTARARVVRSRVMRGNRLVVKMVAAGVPLQRNTRLNVPDVGLSKRSVNKQEEGVAEDWVLDFMGMLMKANFPGEAVLSDAELTPQYYEARRSVANVASRSMDQGADWGKFFQGKLPQKVATVLLLLALSRVGTYIPIGGVDRAAFAETMNQNGMLSYVDTLSGGSISKLGIFSLGIVPFINSSIIFQLLSSAIPELQKLQKEEGIAGRRKFNQLQRYGALGFAVVQAIGQVLYVRPYVDDFSFTFLLNSSLALTAGAMILMYIGEVLSELKLGNGTSLLIFVNIVSALPSSVGQTLQNSEGNEGALGLFFVAFVLITMGIVYVQEAERKIPINYASRYKARGLNSKSYLPFKVNSAGVMPIIFASSLLALPAGLANFTGSEAVGSVAKALYPGGPAYLPVNIGLICFFNYFYTFLQLDPNDVADQLKRQGASIPSVRPGRATSEYITTTLGRLSILGSGFLGVLSAAPSAVEAVTGLQTFRGFAGTSILILVGVATDTARKMKSELVMQEYDSLDEFYKTK